MNNIFDQFKKNIDKTKELTVLYNHLTVNLKIGMDLDDLLRAKIVYSVSALDKFIHELVLQGMVDTFLGLRPQTPKYKNFAITLSTIENINSNTLYPPEYWISQEIVQKHKTLSFQDPTKIGEALSLIWLEEHKWQKLSALLGMTEDKVKKDLKNIVGRRNQIVHEADIDIIASNRNAIDSVDTQNAVDFIYKLGEAIFNLVK